MEVKIFVNNPFQENTILLYDKTGEAVVVDCGCFDAEEREEFGSFVKEQNLKLVGLLDTHLHIDHILGNNFIKDTYGLKPQASREDDFLIKNAVSYAAMLGITGITQPPSTGIYLEEGNIVKFGNSRLKVLAVPGHSPGGLCFYSESDKLLISGDALFAGSIGRTDLPGGNAQQLLQSIREKLFVLDDAVRVIPGHGPATTIGTEKRYNPFF